MTRRPVLDTLCALFFFAAALLPAGGAALGLKDPRCTLDGPPPCTLSDMEERSWGLPILEGMAVLFFALGCRMI